ncbi:MAG TPA: hypothetical protein VK524_02650 [Polyangiaceae bacterium]|nr:hypothetical protein [Polyangiaceae bacterium]
MAWLREASLSEHHALVTSLPDASELRHLEFESWRKWFVDTVALACSKLNDDAVAIFFQTDVKRQGVWVDKGFLLQLAAERAGSALLWHKIVCRAPAGVTTYGRPAYAHLMCFSRALRLAASQSSADVLPELGDMTWPRAMGLAACASACRFLRAHTACRTVVDPFCGIGTMLAVAEAHAFDAIGVELSKKRAERARTLKLDLSVG